jgi:uncharacterized protein YndB with AHSA1/START domain
MARWDDHHDIPRTEGIMIKALSFIVVGLVVAVAAVLIFATTKPDTFHIERTASIQAPPDKIFPLIEDYHKWTSWSPFENKDPAMKRTYSGAESGKGAIYAWDGNKDIGRGEMVMTDVTPPSHLVIAMHFMEPFDSRSTAEFSLQPKGDSTDVTWAMHGPSPYMSKVIGIFFNMDTMIGKEFETGLTNLKTIAERS